MSEIVTIYHVSLHCKRRQKKFAYCPKKKKILTNSQSVAYKQVWLPRNANGQV